jgi:hypothetical protein
MVIHRDFSKNTLITSAKSIKMSHRDSSITSAKSKSIKMGNARVHFLPKRVHAAELAL